MKVLSTWMGSDLKSFYLVENNIQQNETQEGFGNFGFCKIQQRQCVKKCKKKKILL